MSVKTRQNRIRQDKTGQDKSTCQLIRLGMANYADLLAYLDWVYHIIWKVILACNRRVDMEGVGKHLTMSDKTRQDKIGWYIMHSLSTYLDWVYHIIWKVIVDGDWRIDIEDVGRYFGHVRQDKTRQDKISCSVYQLTLTEYTTSYGR